MKESIQESISEVASRDSSAPPSLGTHTPTPWEVSHGEMSSVIFQTTGAAPIIAECHQSRTLGLFQPTREANAAFIVKAVNNHESLVRALRPFGNFPDFFDIEDEDTVVYQNGCGAITVGDLRCAQALLSALSRS